MRTERYSAVEEDEEPEFTAAAAAGEGLEEVVIGRPESGEDSEEGIHVRWQPRVTLDHQFESTGVFGAFKLPT